MIQFKKITCLLSIVFFTGVMIFISCKKEYSCESCAATQGTNPTQQNHPPVARAGIDQTILLPTNATNLDGSGSTDPDNNITSYTWTKISGPTTFNIVNANATQTQVTAIIEGSYLFELKVTDSSGLSDKDTVQIRVSNGPLTNRPPVANAGPDLTIVLPTNIANLSGSGSTDPDNNIVSFLWTKISGPTSFNITNPNGVQTQITNLNVAVYYFELKVTDATGSFDLDTIQVEIKPELIAGNVLFFFRDPTGSLDAANISVIEGFTPQTILARVKIVNFPDANIEGVWSLHFTPWCPISSIYTDATSYGTFNLPPGTYSWTAESVTTDISRFPRVPASFIQYWSTPHSASGTIVVLPGTNCMIKEIIF